MDVVAELFPNRRRVSYSYNFIHLSIQEYLGAVYASQMDVSTQEQLLKRMCIKRYLKNMAMFLAGITKFKGMNWGHNILLSSGSFKMTTPSAMPPALFPLLYVHVCVSVYVVP